MSGLPFTRAQHLASTSKSRCCRQQAKRGLVVSCSANDRSGQQSGQNAPLFQLDSRHNLSMADVRDAYEVCSLIPDPNERHQCYSVFGVDAQRMATYYERVVQLEDQLQTDYHETHSAAITYRHAPGTASDSHAITGTPPPPAAAAAVAVAMLWIAAQHLALF